MFLSETPLVIDLTLFGEEGTAGGEASPEATGGEPVVVYGKEEVTESTATNQTTPDSEAPKSTYAEMSPEDKKKAYHELIKGDFKDLFTEHTQQIINERFKNTKKLESRLKESQPIVDLLMSQYGVKSVAQLNKILEEEILPDLADAAGMTPEAYRKQKQLEKENEELKAAHEQKMINERVDSWFAQAETLKTKYPGFDLRQAADNPKYGSNFLRLLESGIDVEAAYVAAFHETLIEQAKAETAKKAENATLEAIKAGSMRPHEVGAKPQSGIVRKSSVSQLTREDRAEIARKAARGEKIRF
jgi:hypothetical protein